MSYNKSTVESTSRGLATPRKAVILASALLLTGALTSCSESSNELQVTAIPTYEHPFLTAKEEKLYLSIGSTGAKIVNRNESSIGVDGQATLSTEHKIGPFTVNEQSTRDIAGTQQFSVASDKGSVEPTFSSLSCDENQKVVADKTTFVYEGERIAIPDMVIGDSCTEQLIATSNNTIDVATNMYPVTS